MLNKTFGCPLLIAAIGLAGCNSRPSFNATPTVSGKVPDQCVVVLHGLARTSKAMRPLVRVLREHDYQVVNVDYPSTDKTVQELAPIAVKERGVDACIDATTIHFVTHSMGGILVRYYLQDNAVANLGRVVMLAPPNQGSEVVDELANVAGYELINGPAGLQLGTDDESIPMKLGPVEFELGVIAGTQTFNPLLSQLLPNPDDGKVSVESTKVEGMKDFVTLPVTHTFMMQSPEVISQVIAFLQGGSFSR